MKIKTNKLIKFQLPIGLILMFTCLIVHALFDDDAYTLFNTNKNQVSEVVITWVTVNEINKSCDAESRRTGNNGFPYVVEACSFWENKADGFGKLKRFCQIYTTKKTNSDTLGHEVRHCFQGELHK